MHKKLLFLLIFLLSLSEPKIMKPNYNFLSKKIEKKGIIEAAEDALNIKCFWVKKYKVYNFQSVQNKTADQTITTSNGKAYVNFCQDTVTKIDNEESNSTLIYTEDGNNYIRYTGTLNVANKKNVPKNTWSEWIETNEDEKTTGIWINFTVGDTCNGNNKDDYPNYTTKYKITCDKKKNSKNIYEIMNNFEDFNPNNCLNIIKGSSKYACPTNDYFLQEFLNKNKYLTCIVLILIGAFLTFVGGKYIIPTAILIGGAFFSLVVIIIVFNLITITSTKVVWIIIAISFFIGLLLGILLSKALKLLILIVGAFVGYCAGTFLYEIALRYINTNPDTLYWVIIAGCMIIFALIAHFLYIKGLAIGTAIIGGYLIIRGASFVIGHYPDENQIIDLIKHKEWEQLKQIRNYYVYLYYLAWILISLFGILVQLKLIDTKKDKSKKNE